jgi:hypothetical protein
LSYARHVIFGWLDEVLCDKPLASQSDPAAARRIVDIFHRYGGAEGARQAQAVLGVTRLV